MAKTKAPLPSGEVTADEVKGWFPESKFGDPDKAHVEKLARAIESRSRKLGFSLKGMAWSSVGA